MSKEENNKSFPSEEEKYNDRESTANAPEAQEEEMEEFENEDDLDTGASRELSEKEQLKEEIGKEKDKFLRLFAEFENFKKRTGKERIEMFKTANQDVMVAMLPILDDFDRAMNEIKKAKDKNLLKGVELIHNKFKETLRSKGLKVVPVEEGEVFDAEVHEAITQIPAPSEKLKGKIVDVVEKGYKLGDRIIRYPKVVIGK